MIRCTDEGYRIEIQRWSEISERLGTDGGANEHANVGTRPDHTTRLHSSLAAFVLLLITALTLLRYACAACRVRASRARVRACVARVRTRCRAPLCAAFTRVRGCVMSFF